MHTQCEQLGVLCFLLALLPKLTLPTNRFHLVLNHLHDQMLSIVFSKWLKTCFLILQLLVTRSHLLQLDLTHKLEEEKDRVVIPITLTFVIIAKSPTYQEELSQIDWVKCIIILVCTCDY